MTETTISERMAALARDLSSEEDPAATLQHIVDASVSLIDGCELAGITLAQRNGQVATSADTDARHEILSKLQEELGEGPCLDAVWDHRVVFVDDLARDERWPKWRPRAVQEQEVRSMICIQLFTHEDRVGALNLFSSSAGTFDEDQLEEAIAIGAHAAVAVAAAESIEHLEAGLRSRTVIGQATGLVMRNYGLNDHQAFNVLVRLSNEQNRKVATVAGELVRSWNETRQL